MMKKNCFVKEKGKKESFSPRRMRRKQKGIGINGICNNGGSRFFMPKSFCNLKYHQLQPHIFAFAFAHFLTKHLLKKSFKIFVLANHHYLFNLWI